ncbi:integrase arm-type DNA-binding domain-containing protein [Sphingomonas sp. KRR8]|uniref:tyrosine-type recombinase/integrase n=1 Tax=Sphingomonas sp. KRR8 TaxID=2942996 RepID=UPI0020200B67|nr:integrase arm-type DNA-binding domain-containing protein [Sphingomonas sp. KRR8]URD60697.1 integrase arm-type DNA-binding domain-containing protein [Sphingomonas sp. KRR8]
MKLLNDAQCKGAKPKSKPQKLFDSGGLFLFVSPTGHKSWRLKYRFAGKERQRLYGAYPLIGLKEARALRDEDKRLLADGIDPGVEAAARALRASVAASDTFETLARDWFKDQKPRWTSVHADDVLHSLERDVFPDLGPLSVGIINSPIVLAILKKVQGRGAVETAHRLRQRISAIFVYGIAAGRSMNDPAATLNKALQAKPAGKRWPAVKKIEDARKVLQASDEAEVTPTIKLASRYLSITAQRPGMIRWMRWEELHHIDFEGVDECPEAIWWVPAAKMKQELSLQASDEFDHPVPLVSEAVDVLRASYALNSGSDYVFPGARSTKDPMSENALSYLYLREGFRGRHVPHGWRSTFSTIMNEWALSNGRDKDRMVIDLMLAHLPVGISASELKYNRAGFIERRRELSKIWAGKLLVNAPPAARLLEGRRRRKV